MTTERSEPVLRRRPIRIVELTGSPGEIGTSHGRTFADEIRAYADERIEIVESGLWSGGPVTRGDVLEIAASCLPAHERFSAPLHEEMTAMAAAAGISPAEAIVVGGFTDFVDTVRAHMDGPHPDTVIEDDCTAVITPDVRSDGAGFLAQTWDMHDSATEHVILMRITPRDGPPSVVFSTVGCLGQIGMSTSGVAVGINNLSAADGRVGVTWPSVVRAMLCADSAREALSILLAADLAGAHNYLILDREGVGFNVEAMPTTRPVTELGADPIAHTNHTVDPSATLVEAQRPAELVSGSQRRLQRAHELLVDGPIDAERLMALTRDDEAICQRAEPPFRVESSGATVMRPRTGDFWACWGLPTDNDYIHLPVATADRG